MTFKNHVCWKYENIQHILNVEAIETEDHIFLATHHPIKMKKSESIQGGDEVLYTEKEFLKDFLQADDFAFVPVVGSSGTGKSHLIRWLNANIASTEKRKVLLIPKMGTNLKDIIAMILNIPELEGDIFEEYRKRLNQASSSLTQGEAREQLLNQLAIAVGDRPNRNRSKLTDAEEYLIHGLQPLLYDPYFRQFWLKDEGIIHRLVTHILGHRDTVEIAEERREFTLQDLPLNVLDLAKAGEKAREFYSLLFSDEDFQKDTIKWLNQHLDEAITKVLNLGREDLQILIREVRQTLAKKDIELVLLIEDFAKLQGIDREVLEAVLARPQQAGSQSLCSIRTALACTTGYFQGLVDTVNQRITFKVNLDIDTDSDQTIITEADIQQFIARYLNAVRYNDKDLKEWSENYKKNLSNEQPLSFCRECQYCEECHRGFGQVNEIGLYPFNTTALKRMRQAVNSGEFNPRKIIKDLLKYTLENGFEPLQNGSFPPLTLKPHFGRMRLSVLAQGDISNKDPQNAERRKILIDLWTESDTICDLPREIHTAFNLPPLGVEVNKPPVKPLVKERSGTYEIPPVSEIPEQLEKNLAILDNWHNQEILPDTIQQKIREFVYPGVCERIEWDNEMLLQGSFANNTKAFKQRNVQVYSPKVKGKGLHHSGIELILPLNPNDEKEFRETAIAFRGILLYSHYQHWNFTDGDRHLQAYAKCLDRWSNYILDQIRLLPAGTDWTPVPATVELLAITSQIQGQPTNTIEELINSLFVTNSQPNYSKYSQSWQDLYAFLDVSKNELINILKSYIGCTKGSVSTFQMIDTATILPTLKSIRKTWQPQNDLPATLNGEYKILQKVRQKIDQLLLPASQEEYQRQLAIYQSLVAEFGENVKKKEVISKVKEAMQKAKDAGVFSQVNADDLEKVITQFDKTNFDIYVNSMKKIELEKDPYKLLPYLSQDHNKPMTNAEEFIKKCRNFLDGSLINVQNNMQKLTETEEESREIIRQSIHNNLIGLQDLLKEIRE